MTVANTTLEGDMSDSRTRSAVLAVLRVGPHSARGLAGELKTAVPTIYRALGALATEWDIECEPGPRPDGQRGPTPMFFRLAGRK